MKVKRECKKSFEVSEMLSITNIELAQLINNYYKYEREMSKFTEIGVAEWQELQKIPDMDNTDKIPEGFCLLDKNSKDHAITQIESRIYCDVTDK